MIKQICQYTSIIGRLGNIHKAKRLTNVSNHGGGGWETANLDKAHIHTHIRLCPPVFYRLFEECTFAMVHWFLLPM